MKEVYWTMANGQKINVNDMDEKHLRNTLKLILRAIQSQKKPKQKLDHHSGLSGDIAQSHYDMMMDNEWADEMNYHQGL